MKLSEFIDQLIRIDKDYGNLRLDPTPSISVYDDYVEIETEEQTGGFK